MRETIFNILLNFELSLGTLIGVFVLPFAYYGYRSSFWYSPRRVKLLDSILGLIALVFIALIGGRLLNVLDSGDPDLIKIVVLHLLPPVLTLLSIWKGTALVGPKLNVPGYERAMSGDTGYKPEKLNRKVQDMSWDDIVIDDELKQELQSVVTLLKDSDAAENYGIAVPKGILLEGPPGTGKTTIARVIASTAGLSFFSFQANEVVSKWVGESEKNLTKLFDEAKAAAPSVLFIDEVDSIGKARSDKNASHSDNLLNHLLQLMDGVVKTKGLYIVAATNRADLVDSALKRAGRLNRTITIGLPDSQARKDLFNLYTKNLQLEDPADLDVLSKATDGNSAADIEAICNQAGLHAFRREEHLDPKQRSYLVTSADFEQALQEFAVDEAEAEDIFAKTQLADFEPLNDQIEETGWDDIIINQNLREELLSVVELLKSPATAKKYGIDPPKGILLNGPPGTGKTTLARVMANTAGLSFFALQMDEVVSKWVGESEKNLTRLFKAAVKHSPSVIFIDEVDSIGKNRADGNAQHADVLLNHLLQMIDGVVKREGLYIIAATNRADLVDPALKRSGRLSRTIEIPLPDIDARKKLFSLFLSKLSLSQTVSIEHLAEITDGQSGADIREICNQAGLNAYRREVNSPERSYLVETTDIQTALQEFAVSS